MKKKQLYEALTVLRIKLSLAMYNPLLIDNYVVKALRTVLLEFKESGELHEAYKERYNTRWLKNDLRRSLSYSTNILKEDGEETVDIWFDTDCETMNIDNALYMLKELEVYAKQTNNGTHQHKVEVIALTSIEEVEAYDIIKDYPDKLVINI